MSILSHLNEVNDVNIYSVMDDEFKSYGRVIEGYDFSEAIDYLTNNTDIPDEGNYYIHSVRELEEIAVFKDVKKTFYGDMPIQIGYCNGKNSTYNGFEYHKCSEINIAVNDFVLVLGHVYDIRRGHYNNDDARVFLVPANTAVELYATTLHLSPLKVSKEGYRNIVVLAEGTNTPLTNKGVSEDEESKLLLQRNKWVIAHPDRVQLTSQGAFPGIIGENKEIFF